MSTATAEQIARHILSGFNQHYATFLHLTRKARQHFIDADWQAVTTNATQRITVYDSRVRETAGVMAGLFGFHDLDEKLWQEVKFAYLASLFMHKQPELAETFFNSVFTRLFHRRYYNNRYIFVRPGMSTERLESTTPTYRSYYPSRHGMESVTREILSAFDFGLPFEDLDRDVKGVAGRLERYLPAPEKRASHFQINVLSSIFYRNKGAHIIGRYINADERGLFVIPVLHNEKGGVFADTLVSDADDMANFFSFARAYFMVDTEVPSAVVSFLLSVLPSKTSADIYSTIGLHKHGKSEFYRNFLHHLKHSSDQLIAAPGTRGLVMCVFTLPSYPYVFKLIKDEFAPPKDVSHETVKEKYQLVRLHDRVGRMADSLEYRYAAFPLSSITPELLDELKREASSSLHFEDDQLVIEHLYIERRLHPLDLYIEMEPAEKVEAAIIEYGNAIKDLAGANIFPGDLLFKNFGVSRHGRVVFYDYDEIAYMTDCNFRDIPEPRFPEDEFSAEPWYSVGPHDVFPEEFARFLLNNPLVRKVFMQHHADLLRADYWRSVQGDLQAGVLRDVFPYSVDKRFGH